MKMKKTILLLILSLTIFATSIYAQPQEISSSTLQKIEKYFREDGEIHFKFKIFIKSEIEKLTRIISIDNIIGNDVYAFANKKEFNYFLTFGYKFELLPLPNETATGLTMAENLKTLQIWNVYPTYDQYITMMYNFAANYPSLCKIVDAGNSVNGRKILFAVISKNVNTSEAEPKFMYTSTMHGDETTGYILMLRLIDTLLSGYAANPEISYLVDNMEIWINPNANPDGTYYGGNNTVSGAIRNNVNGYDLNRNFPDPELGPNPGGTWQPETIVFMNIATSNYFTMSCNLHGGGEYVNYPWNYKLALTADDNWWFYISRQYADTVHKYSVDTNYTGTGTITTGHNPIIVHGSNTAFLTEITAGTILKTTSNENIGTVFSITNNTELILTSRASKNTDIPFNFSYNTYLNYMTYANNGITNGAAWVILHGIRQDYMTYFRRGRECSIELSAIKLLPAVHLPELWKYNFRSLMNYMGKALYGLSGIVTNSSTSEPVYSKITLNHDIDSSEVYADAITGKYNRMLYAGTYTVTASAADYYPKTINNVTISNDAITILNIQLDSKPLPVELFSFISNVISRDVKLNWTTASELNNAGFEILRSAQNDNWVKVGYITGNGTKTTPTNYIFEDKKLNTGKYNYRLKQIDYNGNFEYHNLASIVEVGVPNKFALSQNYPNPFNPSTKIDFDLPYDSKVSMKLYDISGREVMTLINETKTAGYHTVLMKGNNLSSGMYFYRIIAEGNGQKYVSTKKAMLIK